MANIRYGVAVSAAAGSVGGTTFSRGPGGAIMRNRSGTTNKRSSRQNVLRANVATLAGQWSTTLTQQQRDDWSAYTAATNWTNKLGDSIQNSGLSAFVRLNTLRVQAGLAIVAAAPLAMGHAVGVNYDIDPDTTTGYLDIAEPSSGWDKDTDDHTLLIFQGLPMQPGRVALPSGKRFVAELEGDSITPVTFPNAMPSTYTMHLGQIITTWAMFIDEFNRVSGPFIAQKAAISS